MGAGVQEYTRELVSLAGLLDSEHRSQIGNVSASGGEGGFPLISSVHKMIEMAHAIRRHLPYVSDSAVGSGKAVESYTRE